MENKYVVGVVETYNGAPMSINAKIYVGNTNYKRAKTYYKRLCTLHNKRNKFIRKEERDIDAERFANEQGFIPEAGSEFMATAVRSKETKRKIAWIVFYDAI